MAAFMWVDIGLLWVMQSVPTVIGTHATKWTILVAPIQLVKV